MITKCSGKYDVEIIGDVSVILHHKLDNKVKVLLDQYDHTVTLSPGYINVGHFRFEVLV